MVNHTLHFLVLSYDFVQNAVKMLVSNYMTLDPTDPEERKKSPERWVYWEENEDDVWNDSFCYLDLRVSCFTLSTDRYL